MYGSGGTTTKIVPAVLGVSTVAALPQTGVSVAQEVALAAAVALVSWALVYMGMNKFGKR